LDTQQDPGAGSETKNGMATLYPFDDVPRPTRKVYMVRMIFIGLLLSEKMYGMPECSLESLYSRILECLRWREEEG
jgi:hypothetical protein